jgi:hypothetical protein
MTPITKKFSYHVDAALFGYQWKDAQYIDVEYYAMKNDGKIIASVTNLSAPPYLFGMIVVHGNWLELMNGIEGAAKHNAEKYLGTNNLPPAIAQALQPFTQHIS